MPSDLDSILQLDVPIIVRISERRMLVDEVVAFAPGTILELPKSADEDLDVLVNNVPIGQGQAVKVGENFGVEVTYVGDLKARIAAMAGQQEPADDGIPAGLLDDESPSPVGDQEASPESPADGDADETGTDAESEAQTSDAASAAGENDAAA
ncbi:MAG: FliM/FliN family flagellar motor switch protein [Planctomycetes bacterium]|nr:FliM/FliN family flagellar motor switch protein [Planctomycetota bacterium]NOG52977.1 FliM/FliN family flagellar motor switch protein [Planctomycetota bacterium]